MTNHFLWKIVQIQKIATLLKVALLSTEKYEWKIMTFHDHMCSQKFSIIQSHKTIYNIT